MLVQLSEVLEESAIALVVVGVEVVDGDGGWSEFDDDKGGVVGDGGGEREAVVGAAATEVGGGSGGTLVVLRNLEVLRARDL